MRIATVLRSGGEYRPEHVQRLAAQCAEHAPGVEFFVLSDVEVPGVKTLGMEYGYPGWWAKMELMKPEIGGDILYFDLDTTIVGPLGDMLAMKDTWAPVADFYRPHLLQTSMGVLGKAGRSATWFAWLSATPSYVQANWRGDGEFVNSLWSGRCTPLQDLLPGQVVSYKIHVQRDPLKSKHVGNGFIPPNTRVVCHHGVPRPWQVAEPRFQ